MVVDPTKQVKCDLSFPGKKATQKECIYNRRKENKEVVPICVCAGSFCSAHPTAAEYSNYFF